MTFVNSFGSFFLEFRKMKRKPTTPLMAALIAINIAYLFMGLERSDGANLPQPWEALLFYIPLINTVFLSVLMAVLASRSMDVENKGNTWNLLQTMQSSRSLFLGKTLFGLFWVTVFSILQMCAVTALGKYYNFAGWPPFRAVFLTVLSEIVSGAVVYQIGCLLSLIFPNQFAALSINLGGTLAGFFTMYVDDRILTPWSLMPALRVLNLQFQEGDSAASYEWYDAPASSWLTAVFYLALSLFLGFVFYRRMEEGSLKGTGGKIRESATARTAIPVELIKLRRSPVWIAFFCIPLISAVIGTINFVANQGVLSFTWGSLWTQQSLFLGVFFLPALIGVFCSLLWRMEHTGTNWNLLLAVEPPAKIVRDKLLAASGISALCMLWIGFLYVLFGKIVGLPGTVPPVFYECILCGTLASISIAAVQLFLSLVIRSFAVPVGMALAGSIAGLGCVVKGWSYALPYSMLQDGLRSTNMTATIHLPVFAAASAAYVLLFYLLSIGILRSPK